MSPESVSQILASHGLPGLVIGFLATWLYKSQQQLKDEQEARIEDVKGFSQLLLDLHIRSHESSRLTASAVDRMAIMLESLSKAPRR